MNSKVDPVVALQLWTERRVSLACRARLRSLAEILDTIEDQITNGVDEDVSDDVVRRLATELGTKARALFEARTAEEATWNERTLTDRVDDVLANLDASGMGTAKATRWRKQEDDLFDGGGDLEGAGEEKPEARWEWLLQLHEDPDGEITATGSVHDNASSSTRDDDARKTADAFIRVFAHHGFSASWNAGTREVEVGAFRFQKRRTSSAPDGAKALLPRAAPPEQCALCGGKGWIATDPTKFPVKCSCKDARIKLL